MVAVIDGFGVIQHSNSGQVRDLSTAQLRQRLEECLLADPPLNTAANVLRRELTYRLNKKEQANAN